MADNSNEESTLTRLLQEEVDSATALLDFLQEERARLASDQTFVETHSEDKLDLINRLQQTSQARMDFATQHNLSPYSGNPPAPVADYDPLITSLYSQLSRLARQCFEENRHIGQLLNRRAQLITRLLDSLNPAAPDRQSVTYGENGKTSDNARVNLLNLSIG